MSNEALTKFINGPFSKELEESTATKDNPKAARVQLTGTDQVPAQIFVQVRRTFMKELDDVVASFGLDKLSNDAKKRIWAKWHSFLLHAADNPAGPAKQKVADLKAYLVRKKGRVESRSGKKIPKDANFYVITSYGVVRKMKGAKKGQDTEGLPAWVLQEVEKVLKGKKLDAEKFQKAISGSDKELHGYQLGHGEYGESASTMQMTRLQQKVAQSGLPSDDQDKLNSFIDEYAGKLNIKIDHTQVLQANGKLLKDYFVILSLQRTKLNQRDAKKLEETAMKAFRAGMTQLLVDLGSSTKLRDAIAQVLLWAMTKRSKALAGGKLKITGPIRPKEVIKERSKGKGKSDIPIATAIHYTVGTLGKQLANSVEKKVKKTSDKKTSNPMALLNIINAKLPKEVVGNMGAPALENITGRFAGSVRAVNVIQHKQYPTIQYTYQKHPYQIFEGTEPWSAGGDRDPKQLIERSIREIAAELAIARFHVQRI